jgi:hypothetical protein
MKCQVEKSVGGFAIYTVEEPTVKETRFEGGVATVTVRPVSQVFPGYKTDVFTANYSGNDEWNTDINCGAQRLWSSASTQKIRGMLRKCGFTTPEIREIIQEAKGDQK